VAAGRRTMVSQACYTTSDGRRYSRPYPLYFPSPPERRFPLSSHDTRASIAMADQLDSDSTPQRKRIAVAVRRISRTYPHPLPHPLRPSAPFLYARCLATSLGRCE
jgi:hypothetical protein